MATRRLSFFGSCQISARAKGLTSSCRLMRKWGTLIDGGVDRKLATAIDKAYGYIYSV